MLFNKKVTRLLSYGLFQNKKIQCTLALHFKIC